MSEKNARYRFRIPSCLMLWIKQHQAWCQSMVDAGNIASFKLLRGPSVGGVPLMYFEVETLTGEITRLEPSLELLQKARKSIEPPQHPNCRCTVIPVTDLTPESKALMIERMQMLIWEVENGLD